MSLTDKLHINKLVIVLNFFILITQYITSPLLRTANNNIAAIMITNNNMPTLIMLATMRLMACKSTTAAADV